MTALRNDQDDRRNRNRSQINGELPDRAPLDYLERMFDPVDDDPLLPLGPQHGWDIHAKVLIVLLALALVAGIVGCWPRFG